ncbi:MAG: MFS transporter [Acetobacteraceae bacterium]|nr:MFS transporter [Acetobacteraceae bacterium]
MSRLQPQPRGISQAAPQTGGDHTARPAAPAEASAGFVLPVLALALGHMLSNGLRTLPAIAADRIQLDLGLTAEGLSSLTGSYHIAFALGQIPVGVALDRFGVRPVSLALLTIVCIGTLLAALAGGPAGFLVAQLVLGLGCAGALIAPMTLAAKRMSPARFGLWSGLIQAIGNTGMLLSASPLAWLVEREGWRAGFWAALGFGVFALACTALLVRDRPVPGSESRRSLLGDAAEVLRLVVSRRLRGAVVLAFCSFAIVACLRGLWGGPWLMGLLVAGGPDGLLGPLPVGWDLAMLTLFGLSIGVQPLIFAATRALVPPEQTGKALSAVNLSFFLGAAVLQPGSGVVASRAGTGAALLFLALVVLLCTLVFAWLGRPRAGSVGKAAAPRDR